MGTGGKSRRAFLAQSASSLGAAWLAANYPAIAAAQEFVRTAAASAQIPAFAFFTAEQAVEVEAIAAEIIPTDETPGAREAHVVAFIDRGRVTGAIYFDANKREVFQKAKVVVLSANGSESARLRAPASWTTCRRIRSAASTAAGDSRRAASTRRSAMA